MTSSNHLHIIRPEVIKLPLYRTGTPIEEVRKRYNIEKIVPLASNENPFGTSMKAQKAIAEAIPSLWKYSDPTALALREKLAARFDLSKERIIAGNGSEDLICLLCRACLRPGDKVVTISPSFPLHEIYPAENGADVVLVPVTNQYQFDVKGLIAAARQNCRMLILSNPSNPVGCLLKKDDLQQILDSLDESTLIVLDEAYYEYAKDKEEFPVSIAMLEKLTNPWVVLRTFSKAYGLAGARIGYGLFSSSAFVAELNKIRTPFNVNSLAQVGAIAALDDLNFIEKTVAHNIEETFFFKEKLQEKNVSFVPSAANFFFVDCGENSLIAAEKLMKQGLIVKPWSSPGFENWLRITLGSHEENEMVLQALCS